MSQVGNQRPAAGPSSFTGWVNDPVESNRASTIERTSRHLDLDLALASHAMSASAVLRWAGASCARAPIPPSTSLVAEVIVSPVEPHPMDSCSKKCEKLRGRGRLLNRSLF